MNKMAGWVVVAAVMVALMASSARAGSLVFTSPFQSPGPGWCDGRQVPGCVPWKYDGWPWDREPRVSEEHGVRAPSVEMGKRLECIVRARVWMTSEEKCK